VPEVRHLTVFIGVNPEAYSVSVYDGEPQAGDEQYGVGTTFTSPDAQIHIFVRKMVRNEKKFRRALMTIYNVFASHG
jgi:hypothetical protein